MRACARACVLARVCVSVCIGVSGACASVRACVCARACVYVCMHVVILIHVDLLLGYLRHNECYANNNGASQKCLMKFSNDVRDVMTRDTNNDKQCR